MSGAGKQVRVRGQCEAGQGYFGSGLARKGQSNKMHLGGGDLKEVGGMSHAYLWEKARRRGSKGQVSEARWLACVRTAEDRVAGAEWVRGKIGSERYCREKGQILLLVNFCKDSTFTLGAVQCSEQEGDLV